MPILTDIMDHDLLGPILREGIEKGREEGREEGVATGRAKEARAFLLKQLTKRFGPTPAWVSERMEQLGVEEVEDLGLRFVDAQSLEELFATK